MKKDKVLEKNILELELSTKVNKVLVDNEIIKIRDLWQMKRKDLKDLKISDSDINQITIKLQLVGLDLNKKIY